MTEQRATNTPRAVFFVAHRGQSTHPAVINNSAERSMKPGYIYVLIHPSDPNLYKIGQTTRHPEQRLVEHNSNFAKHAGRIVNETGQKWELKSYFRVLDTDWAEMTFWSATGFADFPYREGIEIERMDWQRVQTGLRAAQNAGVRVKPQVPYYVFANTVWVKKRLEGRGITLLGHVKSKISGKNSFQCSNGHQWRTTPKYVAEGQGCPECGMGQRTREQIRQTASSGVLCLLIHPDRPGLIKIGVSCKTLDECFDENIWGDWLVHRYRNVEEPALAQKLIWELLDCPPPDDREIRIDIHVAEEAFRKIHYRLDSAIALAEKPVDTADQAQLGSI